MHLLLQSRLLCYNKRVLFNMLLLAAYVAYSNLPAHNSSDDGHVGDDVQQLVDPDMPMSRAMYLENMVVDHSRRKVLLFSYHRGGAKYAAHLIARNTDAIFWSEPIGAFYSYHYGQAHRHLPQDIFWYQHSPGNSTLRRVGELEKQQLATFSHNLLSCNGSALPTHLFYHDVYSHSIASPFQRCIQGVRVHGLPESCRSHITQCLGNVKELDTKLCAQSIQHALSQLRASQRLLNRKDYNASMNRFLNYGRCVSYHAALATRCLPYLHTQCGFAKIVGYQATRLTMATVEALLEADPDLYVIYQVRDPRAIATSRQKTKDTYRDSNYSAVLEAKHICEKMRQDYEAFTRLQTAYPHSVMLLRYEDLVLDLMREVERVYKMLRMPFHRTVNSWAKLMKSVSREGIKTRLKTLTKTKWPLPKSGVSEAAFTVTDHCVDVLRALRYL